MSFKAVYFDLGGVIVRTEDKGPRTRIGQELGRTYHEMELAVFENESGKRASVGEISEYQHWQNAIATLGLPESEIPRVRDAFFGGDIIDHQLLDFMRGLRPQYKVGLISNAWDGLRPWIVSQKFDDAFDHMTISAEIKSVKPDAYIYQYALEQLGVNAEEAIFVDDMPRNIKGCNTLGMHGILFQSAGQVMAEIKQLL